MSDYTPTTDFSAKDLLATGDPNKIVAGGEVDDEFDAIQTAVQSKPDQDEIQGNTFQFFTAGGTNTYTATPSPALSSYTSGQEMVLLFTNANTASSTINLNSLGAQTIVKPNGQTLDSGDIAAGSILRLVYDGTNFIAIAGLNVGNLLPRNYLTGFIMSNDTDADHDISVAVGDCIDADNDTNIKLGSAIVKRIDANWAVGTGNGGFPSGLSLTADTWYHMFVIIDVATGTIDAGWDTAVAATNLLTDASAYDAYRRIGSVRTDSASNILGFNQFGDEFLWDAPRADIDTTIGTTAGSHTLSTPPDVRTWANIVVSGFSGSSADLNVVVTALDTNDSTPSDTLNTTHDDSAGSIGINPLSRIRTNTSSQVRARSDVASTTFRIRTFGWLDDRGKL